MRILEIISRAVTTWASAKGVPSLGLPPPPMHTHPHARTHARTRTRTRAHTRAHTAGSGQCESAGGGGGRGGGGGAADAGGGPLSLSLSLSPSLSFSHYLPPTHPPTLPPSSPPCFVPRKFLSSMLVATKVTPRPFVSSSLSCLQRRGVGGVWCLIIRSGWRRRR
jgi:hypothetical protein